MKYIVLSVLFMVANFIFGSVYSLPVLQAPLLNVIKEFEGESAHFDESSSFEVSLNEMSPYSSVKYYVYDKNSDYIWGINSKKDHVVYFEEYRSSYGGKAENKYSEEQCKEIVKDFLNKKYVGFKDIDWKETTLIGKNEYRIYQYTFCFEQFVGDVQTSNLIEVNILPETGEIISGKFGYGDYDNIPKPVIDCDKAMETVLKDINMEEVNYTPPILLYSYDNKLLWIVHEIEGRRGSVVCSYDYVIDAITGKIVFKFGLENIHLALPTNDYIELDYLKTRDIIKNVVIEDDIITIKAFSEIYKLKINSPYIERNNSRGYLGNSVYKEGDKIYIPSAITHSFYNVYRNIAD
ncbi:MAG: hypothetical protein IJS60_11115 [Abditibacteriota bacterium]|nr:hypothetical protein [Abditibacteriota bacterium]